MDNLNLRKALAALQGLLGKRETQAKALKATEDAIERAKGEVAKLVAKEVNDERKNG